MLARLMRLPKVVGRVRGAGPGSLRFHIMQKVGAALLPAYRFRWLQLDWAGDRDFNTFLTRHDHPSSPHAAKRWMMHQLLRLVADVPGDTAECGVFQGAGSYLICKANAQSQQKRTHFIFDSFEGLSAPAAIDGSYWKPRDMAVGEDIVKANLATCTDFELKRGWIPDRFPDVADRRFAFVHIDVDLHQPTLDSLAFFYARMSPGGVILLDDWGHTTCPGATKACDDFLRDRPEKVVALSDGGGFLIKGIGIGSPALLT